MQLCFEDDSPQGVRDRAMLAVLRGSGVRQEELVELKLENYNPHTGAIAVTQGPSEAKIGWYTCQPMQWNWWKSGSTSEEGCRGRCYVPFARGAKSGKRQLTPDAVYKILRRRAEQAGIEAFSPHDLRRTFCTDLLAAGVDVLTVQKLAGHSSPAIVETGEVGFSPHRILDIDQFSTGRNPTF